VAKHRRGGRTTPSKRSVAQTWTASSEPQESGRYTPKTPTFRLHPGWHRVAGWLGVAAGVGVAAANDLMLMGDDLTLLPGGHTELYLLLGMAIAGSSTWLLGLFDRGTTVYR
jgi:hypothetical protein